MVYRLTWLAGLGGIAFALARVERLLRPSVDGLPWEIILVAAAVLGATITWAGLAYRIKTHWLVLINLVAMTLTVIRISVPATTWFIFPTAQSFTQLGNEMSFARDVIRTGVAPVIPLAGIVAILAAVFWAMGAIVVWALNRGRPYLAVLTPLVVYLEFAVMDRRPSGWWTTSFMVLVGLALLAVSFDKRRQNTGLLTSGVTRLALVRSLPSIGVVTLVAALAIAILTSSALADLVPRSGVVEWRATGGLSGEYYGSVSYNPFVGIRQSLVSQTNVPVFVAEIEGELPASNIFWRLLTLDSFDGSQWHVGGDPEISRPEELDAYERPEIAFQGPTETVTQNITVLALQMDWLPAAYSPTLMTAPNKAVDRGFRVKENDASLRFDALTYRGMAYSVISEVPQPDLDVLSRGDDGNPSIVFENAIEADEFETIDPEEIITYELGDPERFLELPEDLSPAVGRLADDKTRGLETDFERAIALESFLRSPGNFRYSTDIVPGHGATDLADWLLDPDSPNYRTGYCEQFSTSMAVMARTLGIPSRVVLGFTPGTPLDDGRIVVRDRNSHAWVELWMPTQGWVRFDPTPRGDGVNPPTIEDLPFDVSEYIEIPEIDLPEFEAETADPLLFRDEDLTDIPRFAGASGADDAIPAPSIPRWALFIGAAGLIVFGFVPAFKWIRRKRRLKKLSDGDIAAAWAEIVDRLSDLGSGPSRSDTPVEFAVQTDPVLMPLAETYGASLYGGEAVEAKAVDTASRSLEDTEDRISTRYSPWRRLVARYRLRTVIPSWMPRLRRKRSGD